MYYVYMHTYILIYVGIYAIGLSIHCDILIKFWFLKLIIDLEAEKEWHPTPVLLPGKSHGWRSLVGCSPWGREESDTTERLHFTFHFHALEKEMATHSTVLAWRIPGMGEPGGCRLWGHTESDTTEVT